MATDKRSKPNSYFAWYVDQKNANNRLAILEKKTTTDNDGTHDDGWQSFSGKNYDHFKVENGTVTVDDMLVTKTSAYTGTSDTTIYIKITLNAVPNDSFAWSTDDITYSSNKLCDTSEVDLGNGIKITFSSLGGFVLDDKWSFTAYANNSNGIKYEGVSHYKEVSSESDDLTSTCGLDKGVDISLIDYMKFRLLEDMGKLQEATYFWKKFKDKVRRFPNRMTGRRRIKVPKL